MFTHIAASAMLCAGTMDELKSQNTQNHSFLTRELFFSPSPYTSSDAEAFNKPPAAAMEWKNSNTTIKSFAGDEEKLHRVSGQCTLSTSRWSCSLEVKNESSRNILTLNCDECCCGECAAFKSTQRNRNRLVSAVCRLKKKVEYDDVGDLDTDKNG